MRFSFALVGALPLALVAMACGPSDGRSAGAGEQVGSSDEAIVGPVCGASANGPVQGRDVSVYQGNFNWGSAKAGGVVFGYARISDGLGTIDSTFPANWANMKGAGVLRGAYQFFEPGEDPVAQANMMVQKVGGMLGDGDLPCMIDVEATGGQSKATIAAHVRTWLDIVEKGTGKRPIIYTGAYFWEGNVGDTSFGNYPLWIAAYGPACPSLPNGWSKWLIWQYSDGNGTLDHDVFNGTLAELQNLAKPPNAPPKGYLDVADCAQIGGWTQDPDVPKQAIAAHVYFDGQAGASGATGISLTAGNDRSDLCGPLGSCNHGFAMATPRSLMDGKAHPVYAYGIDSAGGANTLLTGSPKSFTCAAPAIPAGMIKRWVPNPTVLNAWKFSTFEDLAHYPQATIDPIPKGDNLEATPTVVIADDGSPEVWVVDGAERRHVVDPASMSAWRFGAPAKWAAAKVNALAKGRDWPRTPLLVQGTAPEVYALDSAPPQPAGGPQPGPTGPGGSGAAPDGGASPAPSDQVADASATGTSGGCAIRGAGGGFDGGAVALGIVGVAIAAARGRRRRA